MEGFYPQWLDSGATPIALTSTGDDWTVTAGMPFDVVAVGFLVTTAFSSTDDTVVKFDKRPTAGADTGRGDGDVAEMNIPTGTPAGKLWYVPLDPPVEINAGEQVVAEVTAAASSAGSGIYVMYVQRRPIHPVDHRSAAQGNRNANIVVGS